MQGFFVAVAIQAVIDFAALCALLQVLKVPREHILFTGGIVIRSWLEVDIGIRSSFIFWKQMNHFYANFFSFCNNCICDWSMEATANAFPCPNIFPGKQTLLNV